MTSFCTKWCVDACFDAWSLCDPNHWPGQKICQQGVWRASSFHRCSTAGYKWLSLTIPWLSWKTKQNNKRISSESIGRKPIEMTSITEGVLFAHCINKHFSTKYSPFKLLYNWEPVLPIDVKCKLSSTENLNPCELFDRDIFHAVLVSSKVIIEEVYILASKNIKGLWKKHNVIVKPVINIQYQIILTLVLLRNNKCEGRKDGKFTLKWLGLYVFSNITGKFWTHWRTRMIKNFEKVYQEEIEIFFRDLDGIKEHQYFPEDEIDQSGNKCIENPEQQPLDKQDNQNNQIPDETPAIAINYWHKLPDEIFEKILIQVIKISDYKCKTYNNIINSLSHSFLVFTTNQMTVLRNHLMERSRWVYGSC